MTRRDWWLGIAIITVCLAAAGCSGGNTKSPTGPSQPTTAAPPAPSPTPTPAPAPAPTPIPAAALQSSGQGSFFNCSQAVGLCSAFEASLQNVGPGCAGNTTAILRFYDGSNAQLGSDNPLGSIGGLSSRTIRPNEIVAVSTLQPISVTIANTYRSYRLFPTWTNVRCP